jgi:hypothetical protein
MLPETVFQYRTLLGKCDLGVGLDWDEISASVDIEHDLASDAGDGRRHKREAITLVALMRGDQINDRVNVIEMSAGGLVATNAPFVTRGEVVELTMDAGEYQYRFIAEGVWQREDGDDYRVGLRFVGMPVRLRKVQISEHVGDVVDEIAA